MFAWTRTRKSAHPLAEEADARQLLGTLSREESLPALQRLAELLDALKIARGVPIARLYEIVDAVDSTGRTHYRRAAQEFLGQCRRLTKFQANRIWTCAGEYLVQLAEGYQLCVAAYEADVSGAAASRTQVTRVIGRALRLRAAALKWDRLRYTTHFGKWEAVYRLYGLAQERGLEHERVLLYRGGRLSTIEAEFMQALMLAAAAPQGLLPEQIEAAERIIASLAGHLTLTESGRTRRLYFFDPASSAQPARELPGIRPPITARRFGPGGAEAELRVHLRDAQAGRLAPGQFGLQDMSEQSLQTTLRHLVRHWCGPPADRHARRRSATSVVVVHGFEEVAANVGNLLVEYPFVSDQQVWIIENAAVGGVLALAKRPWGAWVNVGALLAYRHPDNAIWEAGIVRHLSEEDDQALSVGVEVIAQGGVALYVRSDESRANVGNTGVLCVWLADARRDATEMKLLMPPGVYANASALEATLHDRRYLLIPVRLLEAGPDYELGLFKVTRGTQRD
jgi:hypothetical protein